MSLADEVRSALVEASNDLEGRPFTVTFTRVDPDLAPWEQENDGTFPNVTAFDKGTKEIIPRGSSNPVNMRMLLLSATDDYTPKRDDSVTLDGTEYKVKHIEVVAPFGVHYMYRVGLED